MANFIVIFSKVLLNISAGKPIKKTNTTATIAKLFSTCFGLVGTSEIVATERVKSDCVEDGTVVGFDVVVVVIGVEAVVVGADGVVVVGGLVVTAGGAGVITPGGESGFIVISGGDVSEGIGTGGPLRLVTCTRWVSITVSSMRNSRTQSVSPVAVPGGTASVT